MLANYSYNQTQSQIGDELYSKTFRYLRRHNMSETDLANKMNVSPYLLHKALDRNIRMMVFETFIVTLKKAIKEKEGADIK